MAPEHADSRDERIGRILNDYLDSKLQGKPVSEEDLLPVAPCSASLTSSFAIPCQTACAQS